jgi:hypothetical protein
MKGQPGCWLPELPTAHALAAEVAVTASSLLLIPGSGLGIWVQRVPFQCRIRLLPPGGPLPKSPTAQTSLAETAQTPVR